MNTVVVVAPHPDDETFGCAGALLKHRRAGDRTHWLIVTSMDGHPLYSPENKLKRQGEIRKVSKILGFDSVHQLGFTTAHLDEIPTTELVTSIGKTFRTLRPNIVYLPFRCDAHTDHRLVFDAGSACTKWFRHRYVRRVLAYETLSETDFGMDPHRGAFRPNVFVDISPYLSAKIKAVKAYAGETGAFPFPRSEKAVRALAGVRGAAAGFHAAEGFMLLKELA